MLIVIPCPQCQAPAEVTDRFWLPSTDGEIEHLVMGCAVGHHLRMPLDRLPAGVQLLVTGPESTPAVVSLRPLTG